MTQSFRDLTRLLNAVGELIETRIVEFLLNDVALLLLLLFLFNLLSQRLENFVHFIAHLLRRLLSRQQWQEFVIFFRELPDGV